MLIYGKQGSYLDYTTFKRVDSLVHEETYDEGKARIRNLFSSLETPAHAYLHRYVGTYQVLNESLVQFAAVLNNLGRKSFQDLTPRELDGYIRGKVGLSIDFVINQDLIKNLVLPQCLAYLPVDDIIDGLNEVKESNAKIFDDERVRDFYEYFEKNYLLNYEVTRDRYNKKIYTAIEPLFPAKLWNKIARINYDLPRTNIFCETWHNSFPGMLNKHPNVYELINAFRHEQSKVEKKIVQIKTFQGKAKVIAKKENQVEIILSNYIPTNKLETLNLLSLI
ncbi:unnamed protein product [Brachionus calyciflorus]|uniref:Uncharacterized protein n=1 Tax=Brachionus calyciflorus TaxID=104777 RepID=A0A814PQQ2_9BILA|nr:unnamed protein product [Brachionus calyciflorus]